MCANFLSGVNKIFGFVRMKIERRSRWDRKFKLVDSFFRKFEDYYWANAGLITVECFGDSHVKVFRRLNWMYPETPYRFRTVSVMGATAYGINNFKSISGCRKIFEERLKDKKKGEIIILMLGEVDANYLLWVLSQKRNVPLKSLYEKSIEEYKVFILYLISLGLDIVVSSVPLPTVEDSMSIDRLLVKRECIGVCRKEKTKQTLLYNKMLKSMCEDVGVSYLDMDIFAYDKYTETVVSTLINKNSCDHHYDECEFSKVILKTLSNKFNLQFSLI